MKTPILLVALITLLGCGACAGKDSCFDCHRVMEGMSLKFTNDIHFARAISCANCHGGDQNETNQNIAMNASRGFKVRVTRQGVPEFCGKCHSDTNFMSKYDPQLPRGPACPIQDQRSRQAAGRRTQAGGRVRGLPRRPQYPRGQRPAFNRQSAARFPDVRQVPCVHGRGFCRVAAWPDDSRQRARPAAPSATPLTPPSRPPWPCSPVNFRLRALPPAGNSALQVGGGHGASSGRIGSGRPRLEGRPGSGAGGGA